MIYVVCDESNRSNLESTLGSLFADGSGEKVISFLLNFAEFRRATEAKDFSASLFLILVSPIWPGKFDFHQEFGGIKLAASLRRDFHQLAPIIFLGLTGREYLLRRAEDETYLSLVGSSASGYIPFEWTLEKIRDERNRLRDLTERELEQVVIEHCELLGHWRSQAHLLGNSIGDLKNRHAEAQSIVELWGRSILRFAPQHKTHYLKLKTILNKNVGKIDIDDLRETVQTLDAELRGLTDGRDTPSTISISEAVPSAPPKGYEKVLVADDMPQDYVINSLESQFGYQVLRPQAMKLPTAKAMFDRNLPGVVLADMYYKRSDRDTEAPDKRVGDEFIKFVLTHPHFRREGTTKPIVLVTSKAELNEETEIRYGAVNCSGAKFATDPDHIHKLIWKAASERGVYESEEHLAQEAGRTDSEPVDLLSFEKAISELVVQWTAFSTVITSTINSGTRISGARARNLPKELRDHTQTLLQTLRSMSGNRKPTFMDATNIFEQTSTVQQKLAGLQDTETVETWKDLLHSGLAQFAFLPRATETTVRRIKSALQDNEYLSSRLNVQDAELLINELESGLPVESILSELILIFRSAIDTHRSFEGRDAFSVNAVERNLRPREVIDVFIVEDNDYWIACAREAVQAAHFALGGNYQIETHVFTDANSAMSAIESRCRENNFGRLSTSSRRFFAIIDLGLPQGRSSRQTGLPDSASPRIKNGIELVRRLRLYKYNIPLVVHTTTTDLSDIEELESIGISEESVVHKGEDSISRLSEKIIKFTERAQKFVIRRIESDQEKATFRINSIELQLSQQLNETFSAIYQLCQMRSTRDFTIEDIIAIRVQPEGQDTESILQNHIYRIRKSVFESFRRAGLQIDVKQLIEMRENKGRRFYRLNAEVATIEDEEDLMESQALRSFIDRFAVVFGNAPLERRRLESIIKAVGYSVEFRESLDAGAQSLPSPIEAIWIFLDDNNEALIRGVVNYHALAEFWKIPIEILEGATLLLFSSGSKFDDDVLTQSGHRKLIRISVDVDDWVARAITQMENSGRSVDELSIKPIIEIKQGSDLSAGKIKAVVNNRNFTMNLSPLSRILGLLLLKPNRRITWKQLKRQAGKSKPITENDKKNWTRRLRKLIDEKWLSCSKEILDSSSIGLRLNAIVSPILPTRKRTK